MTAPVKRVRRKPMSDINVVPYIDVMLVLLVIFMITAPLLTQGVVVELPPSEESESVGGEADEPLVVSVTVKVTTISAWATSRMILSITNCWSPRWRQCCVIDPRHRF